MKLGDTVVLKDGQVGKLNWVWVNDKRLVRVAIDIKAMFAWFCGIEDVDWPATEAENE